MERPAIGYLQETFDQLPEGFADYKAVADEDLGERPHIAGFKAVAEPPFGDAKQGFSVYK